MPLADDDLSFEAFEQMIEDAAASDDRVVVAQRVESEHDGALSGAGLAQCHAHPADPRLSRRLRGARRCACCPASR